MAFAGLARSLARVRGIDLMRHRSRRISVGTRILVVAGRKTFAHGELRAGSLLCAEAEAIFVAAKPGTFDVLNERRAKLEEELSG